MKRNKKHEKFKEFLRLQNRFWANWEAQRNLGYKPLEKPIHHGYDAVWVLRSDVARRADAERFQSIIDTFGKSVWCRKKSFKTWDYTLKKEVDVKPGFNSINSSKYERLNEWQKKFFSHFRVTNRWGQEYDEYRVNIPEHYLVMKISKSYKTHYKVIDEILLQEEAEIEAKLEGEFYNEREKFWSRHHSNKTWKKIYHRSQRSRDKQAIKQNIMKAEECEHYEEVYELGLGKGSRCWW